MPVPDPSNADLYANLGVLAAAGIAALAGYFGPKVFGKGSPPPPNPVLTGVGIELGTRQQMDMVIAQLCRIADAIENKKQATMEEMLREVLENTENMRDERRWRGPG